MEINYGDQERRAINYGHGIDSKVLISCQIAPKLNDLTAPAAYRYLHPLYTKTSPINIKPLACACLLSPQSEKVAVTTGAIVIH